MAHYQVRHPLVDAVYDEEEDRVHFKIVDSSSTPKPLQTLSISEFDAKYRALDEQVTTIAEMPAPPAIGESATRLSSSTNGHTAQPRQRPQAARKPRTAGAAPTTTAASPGRFRRSKAEVEAGLSVEEAQRQRAAKSGSNGSGAHTAAPRSRRRQPVTA